MSNWQENTSDFETIKMGSPGSFWSYGLNKRLELVKKHINFNGKKILDAGCGLGIFMDKFEELGAESFGIEVDERKVEIAKQKYGEKVSLSPAEKLPFEDNFFDLVFSHETLEHVEDDTQSVKEAIRVLKPGGNFIVFTPNKRWPFETHGIYINGKYRFGNIPLVTYLPNSIFKKLTPHVRNYSNRDLEMLFDGMKIKIIIHKHVFPGFDGLVLKTGILGRSIRFLLNFLEKTPLHYFGISHFLIVEKL